METVLEVTKKRIWEEEEEMREMRREWEEEGMVTLTLKEGKRGEEKLAAKILTTALVRKISVDKGTLILMDREAKEELLNTAAANIINHKYNHNIINLNHNIINHNRSIINHNPKIDNGTKMINHFIDKIIGIGKTFDLINTITTQTKMYLREIETFKKPTEIIGVTEMITCLLRITAISRLWLIQINQSRKENG